MPYKHYQPGPGRYGTELVAIHATAIGTGGLNATANTTTNYLAGSLGRTAWIEGITISAVAAGADADGTLLVTAFKRDVSAGADVALTGAFSLESDGITAGYRTFAIPLLSTLTDAQRMLDPTDTVFVRATSNSAAIDTQPNQCRVVFELAVIN